MSVSSLQAVTNVLSGLHADGRSTTSADSTNFHDILSTAIENIETTTADNNAYTDALLMGEVENIHDAPIAARKAEIAISLTVQIRNRLVDAYTEIMRMQV